MIPSLPQLWASSLNFIANKVVENFLRNVHHQNISIYSVTMGKNGTEPRYCSVQIQMPISLYYRILSHIQQGGRTVFRVTVHHLQSNGKHDPRYSNKRIGIIITITNSSNIIGAFAASLFINHSVQL